jgi:Flp pilus assembly pilin Flp
MAIEPGTQTKPREIIRLTPCGEENVMDLILKFSGDDAGASAVEYGLLVALIAVAIISSVTTFGLAIRDSLATSTTKIFGGS